MLRKLLTVRLSSFMNSSFSIGKNNKRGAVATGVVYLFLGLSFAFMSLSTAMLMAEPMIAMNAEWLYFALFNLLTFSLVFVFSIFETKGMLFECRDNELLLSMPIRVIDIVLSRVFAVLTVNYLEAFVLMLPATVVFAIKGGALMGVFGSLLVTLLLPLLATALATGVGYVVALLSKRFKNNILVSLLLYLGFFAVYFFLYGKLMNGMTALETDPDGAIERLISTLGIAKGIGMASMLSPLPFSIMVLTVFAVSGTVLFLIVKNYADIITKSDKTIKTEYVKRESRTQRPVIALSKKEISRFFSSVTYIMNGGIGFIMQIILLIAVFTRRSNLAEVEAMFSEMLGFNAEGLLPTALTGASVLMLAMGMIMSASSLSLEGSSLWILASSPIKTYEIIIAKMMPELLISTAASVVATVIIAVTVSASLPVALLIFLIHIVASFLFSMLGITMNIIFPKFYFESESQVIKQSVASGISLLAAMILGVAATAGGIFVSLKLGAIFALAAVLGLFAILASVTAWSLFCPCAKRLEGILKGE